MFLRILVGIMVKSDQLISWLLEGDVSVQYQVCRDLLHIDRPDLQDRIALEGWGKQILSNRQANGHWGLRFYQPKWISTHYTLLDLRNLCLSRHHKQVRQSIHIVLDTPKSSDGGIALGPSTAQRSDVCVNGMFLNYASYFGVDEEKLHSIVDCILGELMPDGGFNCRSTRSGARHSSLHTTISVLEGLYEFIKVGNSYRLADLLAAKSSAEEFILLHQLFLSDHTGEIIHKDFLKLTYPCRWKYNILRAMDYFQYAEVPWDNRMQKAVDVLINQQNKAHTWNLHAHHPGQVHVAMEKAGQPSRWNTLRVMRVMGFYGVNV